MQEPIKPNGLAYVKNQPAKEHSYSYLDCSGHGVSPAASRSIHARSSLAQTAYTRCDRSASANPDTATYVSSNFYNDSRPELTDRPPVLHSSTILTPSSSPESRRRRQSTTTTAISSTAETVDRPFS